MEQLKVYVECNHDEAEYHLWDVDGDLIQAFVKELILPMRTEDIIIYPGNRLKGKSFTTMSDEELDEVKQTSADYNDPNGALKEAVKKSNK
jgi:hypothetical protein